MGVLEAPKRTTQWLENADSIYYPAVICKGDFKLFFIFFYCARLRAFMACFVSYIYMFVLLRKGRVFL